VGATWWRAVQLGPAHVVAKPVALNHLAAVAARVWEKVRLMRQNVLLRETLEQLLSTPRPGKAREIWKAVEHLPADLRRGGGGGDGGGGRGGGGGGGGRRRRGGREVGGGEGERGLRGSSAYS